MILEQKVKKEEGKEKEKETKRRKGREGKEEKERKRNKGRETKEEKEGRKRREGKEEEFTYPVMKYRVQICGFDIRIPIQIIHPCCK